MANLLRDGEYTDVPADWDWSEVLSYVKMHKPSNIWSWAAASALNVPPKPKYLVKVGGFIYRADLEPDEEVYRSVTARERIYDGDALYKHIT